MYYKISIQFAIADAPDFEQVMPVIDRAIAHYNSRSLIAKNPKQIVEKRLLDPHTLQILLQSEAGLPHPSKALRLFSGYLVDPNTEGHLNRYISGKQLFKMQAEEFLTNEGLASPVRCSEYIIESADVVKRLVQILMLNREQDKELIKKIQCTILEWKE